MPIWSRTQRKIETELIPVMVEEADRFERVDLSALSNEGLSSEIEARVERYKKWPGIYREECIPFAHGIRLFGQKYNDVIKPGDPFEFVNLLSETGMVSVQRNRSLAEALASRIRGDRVLPEAVRAGPRHLSEGCHDPELRKRLLRDSPLSGGTPPDHDHAPLGKESSAAHRHPICAELRYHTVTLR